MRSPLWAIRVFEILAGGRTPHSPTAAAFRCRSSLCEQPLLRYLRCIWLSVLANIASRSCSAGPGTAVACSRRVTTGAAAGPGRRAFLLSVFLEKVPLLGRVHRDLQRKSRVPRTARYGKVTAPGELAVHDGRAARPDIFSGLRHISGTRAPGTRWSKDQPFPAGPRQRARNQI